MKEIDKLAVEQAADSKKDRQEPEQVLDLVEARNVFRELTRRVDLRDDADRDTADRPRGRQKPNQGVADMFSAGHGFAANGKLKHIAPICSVCAERIVYPGKEACEFGVGEEWDLAQLIATGRVLDVPLHHRGNGYCVRRVIADRPVYMPICPCNGCGNRRQKSRGRPRQICFDPDCERERDRRQKAKERKRGKQKDYVFEVKTRKIDQTR